MAQPVPVYTQPPFKPPEKWSQYDGHILNTIEFKYTKEMFFLQDHTNTYCLHIQIKKYVPELLLSPNPWVFDVRHHFSVRYYHSKMENLSETMWTIILKSLTGIISQQFSLLPFDLQLTLEWTPAIVSRSHWTTLFGSLKQRDTPVVLSQIPFKKKTGITTKNDKISFSPASEETVVPTWKDIETVLSTLPKKVLHMLVPDGYNKILSNKEDINERIHLYTNFAIEQNIFSSTKEIYDMVFHITIIEKIIQHPQMMYNENEATNSEEEIPV